MNRIQKRYNPQAVWDYVEEHNDLPIDILDGSLIDTYIIYHPTFTEVFEEVFETCWSSAYIRHIYKKLPQRFIKALEEPEQYYNEH